MTATVHSLDARRAVGAKVLRGPARRSGWRPVDGEARLRLIIGGSSAAKHRAGRRAERRPAVVEAARRARKLARAERAVRDWGLRSTYLDEVTALSQEMGCYDDEEAA